MEGKMPVNGDKSPKVQVSTTQGKLTLQNAHADECFSYSDIPGTPEFQ